MSHVIRNGTRLANLNKNILTGKLQLQSPLSLSLSLSLSRILTRKIIFSAKELLQKIPAYYIKLLDAAFSLVINK